MMILMLIPLEYNRPRLFLLRVIIVLPFPGPLIPNLILLKLIAIALKAISPLTSLLMNDRQRLILAIVTIAFAENQLPINTFLLMSLFVRFSEVLDFAH